MPALEDDRLLLEGFRSGTPEALSTVFNAYVEDVAKIVRFGFSLDAQSHVNGVSDPEEQKEIVQEVFVRAFAKRARDAYDGLRPYRPYLLRIAKNLMIDRARKIARRPTKVEPAREMPSIDVLIDGNAPMPEYEEEMDWKRQRRITRRYMESLSPESSKLVQLRFVECRAQADVAMAMGITRRRVRTLEKRILAGLVRLLRDERAL